MAAGAAGAAAVAPACAAEGAEAGVVSTLASAGAAIWPGGSANRVNLRAMRDEQPALRLTRTKGSSMAEEVLTLTSGVPEDVSTATDTTDRGRGTSPTVTSAARHSGGASPVSRRRPTTKSSEAPRTALDCARPKPQDHASRLKSPNDKAQIKGSGERFRRLNAKEETWKMICQ